jgi:hypothetical protein
MNLRGTQRKKGDQSVSGKTISEFASFTVVLEGSDLIPVLTGL